MRFTCRIPKATETHPEYVILVACLRQQLFRERTSVTFIRTSSVLLPIKSLGLHHKSPFWRLVCKLFQSRQWQLLSKKHVMFSVVLAVSNASGHPTNLTGSDISVKDVSLAPDINQSYSPWISTSLPKFKANNVRRIFGFWISTTLLCYVHV